MKNIFFLKNTLNNIKQTSICKYNTNIVCKNLCILQRQIPSFILQSNSNIYTNNINNKIEDLINLSQPEEIIINNPIINIEEHNQTDITDFYNNQEKIKEIPNIQIDLKGRNSKTPKRVKINILIFIYHISIK
jgi:hypothetical protein